MLFRLTENVFIQDSEGPEERRVKWEALRGTAAADPQLLSHVIHFYRGREVDRRTQETTVKSVLEAKRCAIPKVQLLSVLLQEEQDVSFEGFCPTRPLTRTISDIGKFAVPRRLPLLFDIIDAGAERCESNAFMVWTNCDICLNPGFYNSVSALLRYGVDCLVINRMTVGELDSYEQLPELGGTEVGGKHQGFDCFIFPVSWAGGFVKPESCVGIRAVMRPLLYNLVARASRMLIMKRACLTYHHGDEMLYNAAKYQDYTAHNWSKMGESLDMLSRDPLIFQRLGAFCIAHKEPFVPKVRT